MDLGDQVATGIGLQSASALLEADGLTNATGPGGGGSGGGPRKLPEQRELLAYHEDLLNSDAYPEVLEYLTGSDFKAGQRGLSLDVLRRYGVGAAEYRFRWVIVFLLLSLLQSLFLSPIPFSPH